MARRSYESTRDKLFGKYGANNEENKSTSTSSSNATITHGALAGNTGSTTVSIESSKEKDNSSTETKSTKKKKTSYESTLSKLRAKYDETAPVDETYINAFLKDAQSFLNRSAYKVNDLTWSSANAGSVYDSWKKEYNTIQEKEKKIRAYLDEQKDLIDSNTYKELNSILDQIHWGSVEAKVAFVNTNKHYSQWETEDEYNKWKKDTEEYEAMMAHNTKNGAKEIEHLESILDEYKYLVRNMNGDKDQARLKHIISVYGGKDNLETLISQKKSYNTQAERLQEGVRLGSVGDKNSEYYDPEYVYWSNTRDQLPTREDLVAYDSMMDQSKWYTDADGKLYDAYGNEIDPYNTDDKGNILHPSQGSVDTSDKLGLFLAATKEDVEEAAGTYLSTGGTWETIVAEGSQRHWDQMKENEINTYYYYLNKEGSEAAEKYLDSIQETLNHREGTEKFKALDDKTAQELLFKVAVGFDQFNSGLQGLRNAVTGNDEYIPVTATQVAGSLVQEDLGDVGFLLPEWMSTTTDEYGNKVRTSIAQAAGDFITTGANMLPSILASSVVGALNPTAGAALGTGLLSASAGGNAYTEMINFGYDKNQARTYAAMVGASEAALQSLLGGISQLGGGAISNGVTKILGQADNVLAKFAIKFGNSAVGKVLINAFEEGSEEYFQSILEPWFKNIIFGEENEINLLSEEALYSAFLGALTGGAFEGTGVAVDAANNNAMLRDTGKAIIEADGGVDALKALAMDVSGANPNLTKQANKVSSEPATGKGLGKVAAAIKNSNNQKQVGKLYQAVTSEVSTQNQADIAKALNESGFSKTSAKNIAEAVMTQRSGEKLNKFQEAVLESVKDNQMVTNTVNKIINDSESGVSKRTDNMDTYSMGILLGKGIGPETTREAQKTSLKVSEEGKTVANGKEIKVEFADNGMIATEDGTVTVNEVEYSTATEAYVVETIATLGLKADAANSLLRTANAKGMNEVQAQAFAMGLKTAYNMGRIGNLSELTKNYFTSKLTSEQRETAYAAGLRERNALVAARQTAINEAQKKAEEILASKSEPIDKSGSVIFENGLSKKDLSRKPKLQAAYLVARKVSSTMGNDIHLYSGKVEYGFHDAETGDVWLNINASASGKDLTLFTLSHEMVHHAKLWSPEEFTAFADMLLEAYGEKGVSVEQMIKRQIRKAKSHGITLTREAAYEEVIADACGRMLLDSNALEKLSLLEETNPGIIEKIKAFLQEFLKKIRDMFKDVQPHTNEAIYLSEMEATVKNLLYEKFENLMVSTGKTYSTIKAAYGKDVKAVPDYQIITDGALTIEGNGKKYSIKSMKHDIAEGKMFEDLQTVCGWTEAETTALKEQLEDIVSYMIPFRDIVDMNETAGRDDRRFSPYKPNSDPLYTISMDFSTLCSKRLLTQYVIENLQLRENRPMSAEEQIAIRDMLIEYRQQEKALQVACAMCYVEAARLKSPKQMERWLNDPASLMRNYFATQNPEFKQKIKDAQGDFKESRGYDRKATKKEMKQKDVTELNKIGPRLYAEYIPSAEEQAIIDKAVTLPNSTYLTAGNLADLSESDPIIYKAYTSFVRTATRSKGLEEDIAYYYGDSTRDNGNGIIVSDSFIESVNNENGTRFSSWSDWRIEHLLDYITAVIDNSVRGAAMHGYTKFPDEVRVLGNTGMMFNMSGVAGTQTGLNEDGSLSFSDTESINFDEAKALREEFPETAGLQCIGVGDEHIRQLLRSDIIDYVIPYHTSGLNAVLRRMVNIHGWKDYTGTQHATPDKSISKDKAKDPDNWHKEPVFSEFFVGYKTGMTGVEAMKKTAENYIRMCQERGLTPKFAQFMDEDGYWKLLIDRKMVNNKTGELIQQKPVKPVFKTETIKEIVNKYVDNYDGGLQTKALNHIVENWDSLPGRIKDLKKAKKSKTKKALDTLANETVAAKPGRKFALPQMGDKKSPSTLTEQDLRDLLQKAKDEGMDDGTYFPIRINTPDVLLDAIRMVAKKQGITNQKELYKLTADRPIAIQVFKARQALTTDDEWEENGRPHNLTIDDVVNIVKKMDDPQYIVYEDSTGRYVEILKYRTERGSDAFAVVELENFKDEPYLNGYAPDMYNILVTLYQPDAKQRVTNLLNGKDNIVIHPQKNKGNSQVTSGIHVPSVLNKLPFAPNVSQEIDGVKTDLKQKYSLPNSDDISTRSLLANAFESVAQDEKEREKLSEYKAKIDFVNTKEQRLREINAKLFQSKTPIPRDERIKLQDEAVKLRNQITIYDSQLLRLEASKPLQNVLNREKAKVRKQMKAQAKEDIRKAKLEEQQRYKNRAANHDKVEMRKKIRKTIRDLDKILNHGNKKQNVKDDMKGLVSSAIQSAEVLFTENYSNEDIIQNGFGIQLNADEQKYFGEAQNILQQIFNLGTGYEAMAEREKLQSKLAYRMSKLNDAFYRERNRLNETKVSEVLGNLADAYSSLQTSEYLYIKDAYHASVHEYLKYLQNEVGGTTVRNMSIGQLENLHKAYTMVLETVRNANKMFNENLKESRDQLANAIMREVLKAGGEHSDWSKLGIKYNKFTWNNLKPIYAAERIGSEAFSRVVSGLFDGQYKWATNMEKARAFQLETAKKYGVNNWDMEKSFEFTSSNGLDFTLNLEQILSLYAYSKRDAAHDHITNGGIVFGKNTEVKVEKYGVKVTRLKRSATTYSISDTLLGEIISKLDEVDPKLKKYVDEMQKYLSETMGGLGNEVSMKLYGVKLFGEENYFPLRSAGQYMEKAREADLHKQQGHTSLVNSGFTHAVKPNAKNPIVLDGFMDVWAGHVNDMAMYNGMVLPMEDFRKVYNYHTPFGDGSTSVNGVIENAYGAEATGYFDQLYQELNSGAISDPRESDMLKWVSKFKKASVMLSTSVVVQQPSAIGRAFALIDPKHFAGQRISESDAKKQWNEVKKYAPVAIIKEMGGFDTHTGASAKDFLLAKEYSKDEIGKALKDKEYLKDKADAIMGYLPAKADEITWVAIWQAVKREVRANNPNLHGEEFLKNAGARFSEVIEKTQVYDSVLARSANMRAKTGLMTMATAFLAEPTTTANMIQNAFHSKKNVGRVIASVATSIILNNLLASAIYAMRDDDEDETWLEKYVQAFTSGMVDDINPLTYLPFVKDVWSIFQGYDVERSDMSVISDVSDALKKVLQIIGKDTSDMDENELAEHHKTVWSAIWSLADGVASAFGVPLKNARREVMSVLNTIRTAKNGLSYNKTSLLNSTVDALVDTIPVASYLWKHQKSDRLYDAIIKGDAAYEERLRSEYDDDKQITNAIRKGLRENDSRLYEAALAQIDGRPEERVRLQRQVIADGFTQDDVVAATNAIITKLSPSASASEPKKKGLYTTEDFALFVSGGKTSLANEAKKDIIATHQLNGKTADEAEQSFQSSAKTELKEMLIAGTVTVAAAEHALKTYCGLNADEAKTKVNEWSYFKTTGIDYSDKREMYLSGEMSASELTKALVSVEGKTEEEAAKTVVSYTRDAYEEGLFDRSKAADIMVTYGGLTDEEAESKLRYIDIKQQFPDTFVDDAWVDEYYEEVESSGISIEVFVDYRNQVKGITGKDKKEGRMAVINSLPISNSQKDALYYAEGWAASKLHQAPWH